MSKKGVPADYIMWLNGFLSNRQARVRLDGAKSSSKQLYQAVPQGCVLSLLLFLFFINNLAEKLNKVDPARAARLVISLFADDDTIVTVSFADFTHATLTFLYILSHVRVA